MSTPKDNNGKKGKVRSISPGRPRPKRPLPLLSTADHILRDIYEGAKGKADGGVILFYDRGVFVTFLDDAVRIGDAIGVVPQFARGGARLLLTIRKLSNTIRTMRNNGIEDIWIWNRIDGVKPYIG